MSFWTNIIEAPKIAVRVPMRKAACRVVPLRAKSGARRLMRNPPALMMPACNKAWTGVGANSEPGSQICSGNCADFPIAPMNMSDATAVAPVICSPGPSESVSGASAARVKSSWNSSVP